MRDVLQEIKRLEFENVIWIIFAFISILNIFGDTTEEKYLKTNNIDMQKRANIIFEFTLVVTFIIYIYFLSRNYTAYINATSNNKKLLEVKLWGSAFLIAGIILLIYFQFKQSSFIGSPA